MQIESRYDRKRGCLVIPQLHATPEIDGTFCKTRFATLDISSRRKLYPSTFSNIHALFHIQMGGSGSSCTPANIQNLKARAFFEHIKALEETASIPDSVRKSKQYRSLLRVIFDTLKRSPEQEPEFALLVTGLGVGPVFVEHFLGKLEYPAALTKVSMRKSGLKNATAPQIANFLRNFKTLKQFDAGENDLGEGASVILQAAVNHPTLTALQLEGTHASKSICDGLGTLLRTSRLIETVRVGPVKLDKAQEEALAKDIEGNLYVKNISVTESLDSTCKRVCERNIFVSELVDSIARSPFQRQFRTKIDSFKSVKGRQMVMGKAGQKEKLKGSALFEHMQEADQRAKNTEVQEGAEKTDLFRSGHAEMIGRRDGMEDVSIILKDIPVPGAMLFGLFDGHGGREAAEAAAQQLPQAIADRLKSAPRPDEAYTAAFRQLHMDIKPWCVYVGTTAVIAVVEGTTLTVANVGDTRCVLCRDGKAVRISVDHKPDLPEETSYIQSKGGFVKDGRVGGMLAVSRALGDGILGDAVNPTPYIRRVELTEDDSFMILACDGVWDVMSDQTACDLVAPEIDPLVAAKKLRDTAFEMNSLDNISVIVVFLSEAFANRPFPDEQ